MDKKIIVKGMHCSSCEFLIKDSLQDLGIDAVVNYKKGEIILKNIDVKKIELKKIYKAIEENGYTVEL